MVRFDDLHQSLPGREKKGQKYNYLEENVVSLTRTLLFMIRPSKGNSVIPSTLAL